jgi:TP901 family phage tail tape measure protein
VRELTLKYVVQLASNIGQKSAAEAKLLEEANKHMQEAIQATGKDQDKLVQKVGQTSRDLTTLNRTITEVGTNSSVRRQAEYFDRLGASISRAHDRAKGLATQMASMAAEYGPNAVAAMWGAKTAVTGPLRAYATLEQAQTDLRVAMMDRNGRVSGSYAAINKEAVDLGNKLPGTTKDFVMGALALKANGTPDSVIAGGGLRASSYLGVLLHMQQESAAEMVAKARESYALTGPQLIPAADKIQRARFGLGIKPEDITAANTYMASTLNTIGWTGLDNMGQVLAMQGLGQQQGMVGSVFGTNMKDFIQRLALADTRMGKKSKEAEHVRGLMKAAGIGRFEVFGADGQMVSPVAVAEQMEQFNRLKPQERIEAFHQIFGDQGGQIAQLLAQKGAAGVREKMGLIDNQGDLNTKLAITTETLGNKFEALTGTVENAAAAMAKPVGNAAKPAIDGLNNVIGGPIQGLFESHPAAGVAGMVGLTAAGAAAGWGGWNIVKAMIAGRGAQGAGARAAAAALGGDAFMGAEGLAGLALGSQTAWAARAMGGLKIGGIGSLLGAGIDAVSVLGDDTLTDAGRRRGLWRAGASGLGGTLGGAAAGAAVGSVVPVLGTAIGGMVGGALGYWGGGAAFDSMWRPDARRDYISVTAPNGAQLAGGQGGATVQLGEGKLEVNVRVTDDRVTSSTSVMQPLPLIKISPGATNPGGF